LIEDSESFSCYFQNFSLESNQFAPEPICRCGWAGNSSSSSCFHPSCHPFQPADFQAAFKTEQSLAYLMNQSQK